MSLESMRVTAGYEPFWNRKPNISMTDSNLWPYGHDWSSLPVLCCGWNYCSGQVTSTINHSTVLKCVLSGLSWLNSAELYVGYWHTCSATGHAVPHASRHQCFPTWRVLRWQGMQEFNHIANFIEFLLDHGTLLEHVRPPWLDEFWPDVYRTDLAWSDLLTSGQILSACCTILKYTWTVRMQQKSQHVANNVYHDYLLQNSL